MGLRNANSAEVGSRKDFKPRWEIRDGYRVYNCEGCGGLKYIWVKGGGVARCNECFPEDVGERMDLMNSLEKEFKRIVIFNPEIHQRMDARFLPEKLGSCDRVRSKEFISNIVEMISGKITKAQAADRCFQFGERFDSMEWGKVGIKLQEMAEARS